MSQKLLASLIVLFLGGSIASAQRKQLTDFDGDGKQDIAVFQPSNGTWYIQGSQAGYWSYGFGQPGDVPVPGDYDGDGHAEAGVFRVSNSTWYISPTCISRRLQRRTSSCRSVSSETFLCPPITMATAKLT